MKIEIDKQYIDAIGNVVSISRVSSCGNFFMDEYYCWYSDGRYYRDEQHEFDLICEVVPHIYKEYESNIITIKQIYEQHIKYWSEK